MLCRSLIVVIPLVVDFDVGLKLCSLGYVVPPCLAIHPYSMTLTAIETPVIFRCLLLRPNGIAFLLKPLHEVGRVIRY